MENEVYPKTLIATVWRVMFPTVCSESHVTSKGPSHWLTVFFSLLASAIGAVLSWEGGKGVVIIYD